MALRNTITLPLWLQVFPETKDVDIERYGVDVAKSLRARRRKRYVNTNKNCRNFRPISSPGSKRTDFIGSQVRVTGKQFLLWQEYTCQAPEVIQQLPNHRVLELRYEHVLEDPVSHVWENAEFCEIDLSN